MQEEKKAEESTEFFLSMTEPCLPESLEALAFSDKDVCEHLPEYAAAQRASNDLLLNIL